MARPMPSIMTRSAPMVASASVSLTRRRSRHGLPCPLGTTYSRASLRSWLNHSLKGNLRPRRWGTLGSIRACGVGIPGHMGGQHEQPRLPEPRVTAAGLYCRESERLFEKGTCRGGNMGIIKSLRRQGSGQHGILGAMGFKAEANPWGLYILM